MASAARPVLGVSGSVLLGAGVFFPVLSAPLLENQNLFQHGRGDGTILLVIAAVSLIVTLARLYRLLWITGLAAAGTLAYAWITFRGEVRDLRRMVESEIPDSPLRGLADMAIESVDVQWGWAVLAAGAALILLTAALKPPTNGIPAPPR